MSARRFHRWDTGGGCTALRRDFPDGRHFLITDDGGCDRPKPGKPALIGYYNEQDEPIGNGARLITWPKTRRAAPVEVETRRYIWSHGHAPRGRGAWAFRTGKGEQFIPGIRTYGEAKRIAVAEARRMGDTLIEVLP